MTTPAASPLPLRAIVIGMTTPLAVMLASMALWPIIVAHAAQDFGAA